MRKIVFLMFLLITCSLLFFGLYHFVTAQETTVPESVTVDNTFGKVTFSHKAHSAMGECKTCHHMGNTDQKCEICHTTDAKLDAKSALHKNCIDCHKEKAAGPTGCMDCHKK